MAAVVEGENRKMKVKRGREGREREKRSSLISLVPATC